MKEGGRIITFSTISNNLKLTTAMLKSHLFPFGLDNLQLVKQLRVNLQDFSHIARELAHLNIMMVKFTVSARSLDVMIFPSFLRGNARTSRVSGLQQL